MSSPQNFKNTKIDLTNDSDNDLVLHYAMFSLSTCTSYASYQSTPPNNTSVELLMTVISGVKAACSLVKETRNLEVIKNSSKQKYSLRSLPSTITVGGNNMKKTGTEAQVG